jgi:hypothetical protein
VHTYATALALSGVTVPDHLTADAAVPILTGPQAQGDLMLLPVPAPTVVQWSAVPTAGIQLIRGEATGNTHWLHTGFESGGVRWAPAADGQRIGYLLVPDGQSALLIHTDEHGANGVGPGSYAIHRKRAQRVTVERGRPEPAPTYLVED